MEEIAEEREEQEAYSCVRCDRPIDRINGEWIYGRTECGRCDGVYCGPCARAGFAHVVAVQQHVRACNVL